MRTHHEGEKEAQEGAGERVKIRESLFMLKRVRGK